MRSLQMLLNLDHTSTAGTSAPQQNDIMACVKFDLSHRLGINRSTKRGKENSPSEGHCQKPKRDGRLFYGKFLKESHIVTRLAKERAPFLNINDISFFGTPDCHRFCSIAGMLNL
jgi:hypothetical protein